METNFINITNHVFVISTNAVPVTVESPNGVFMFFNGFAFGFPFAVTLFAVWVIMAGLFAPKFPGE